MSKGSFDWDPEKDLANKAMHGISFSEVQNAFTYHNRLIAEDLTDGKKEERYFCFGKVAGCVLTVRFTYRTGVIRIFGAGYWRKGKRTYEHKN